LKGCLPNVCPREYDKKEEEEEEEEEEEKNRTR
jgi:hypothetical protein